MNTVAIHASSCGLVPATMAEAMQFAEMMADSKLVPTALQKSPSDCLLVIMQAVRWQMDPFAVAQECSVIQGKLMHSGKLVAAVINSRGNLAERLSFSYKGEGDDRTITVSGKFRGEANSRNVSVIIKNARTNNQQWQKQPDQQLMYHASRVWGRRHAPELMLGVYSPEEFDEGDAAAEAAPKQTARARIAEVEAIPDADERAAEAERMHDEWSDKAANGLRNAMATKFKHDENGVIWDETEERLATPDDEIADDGPTMELLIAAYIDSARERIRKATNDKALLDWWRAEKDARAILTELQNNDLFDFCMARRKELQRPRLVGNS